MGCFESAESLHLEVAVMGPASIWCFWGINDAPAFLSMPDLDNSLGDVFPLGLSAKEINENRSDSVSWSNTSLRRGFPPAQ